MFRFALAVLGLAVTTSPALAVEKPLPHTYYVVADFIDAGTKCERGVTTSCTKRDEMCPVVVANDRQLRDFIRNDYPIRSKNGGMNIDARYTRAKRGCA